MGNKTKAYPGDEMIKGVEAVVSDKVGTSTAQKDPKKWKLVVTPQGYSKWVRREPRSGQAPPSVLEKRKQRVAKEKEGGPPSVGSKVPIKFRKKKESPY